MRSVFSAALLLLPLVSALPAPITPAEGSTLTARASPAGCGKFHLLRGITEYRGFNTKSGKSRSYSIHIPSSYDKNKEYPVVLGFHGSSSIGLFFEMDSGLSGDKFSGNKIMVYPNGDGGSWAGPTYSKTPVAEDLAFVADLLDDLRANYCVDNRRIYATGMSNGGGFVNTIACSAVGGQFAALAPGSGAFYTDVNGPANGCKPARTPLPILEIHGGNDKTVFYAGGNGDGGPLPPVSSWLDWWAQRNGCTDPKQEDSFEGKVHHLSWTCGGKAGALQHYKVDTMGHAWASTSINLSQLAALEGPTFISGSEIVMKFFDGFVKPE